MQKAMMILRNGLILTCLAVTGIPGACAQDYPSKPIRLIVSSAPVGANDIIARLAGAKLTEALGQQVIIDNRPGASGILGIQFVAKSAPDGYNLLLGNFSTMAVNLSLFDKLPYDPVKEFQPITLIARVPQVLVVHPSLPVKSVKDLIALAKANPGKLNYGSGLSGSGAHLSAELLKWLAKIDIVMVPYKSGVGGALTDLVAGQITLVFGGVPGVAPYLQTKRLRALGVTGAKRVPVYPDLPTIEQAGVPGYELTLWYGVLAPAGTPMRVVSKLNATLVRALQMPDVKKHFFALGADPAPTTPEEFAAMLPPEIKKWAAVVKAAGIKAE
jgi:tripartite-type tricarboxylate transporter receptor subunit TctC